MTVLEDLERKFAGVDFGEDAQWFVKVLLMQVITDMRGTALRYAKGRSIEIAFATSGFRFTKDDTLRVFAESYAEALNRQLPAAGVTVEEVLQSEDGVDLAPSAYSKLGSALLANAREISKEEVLSDEKE